MPAQNLGSLHPKPAVQPEWREASFWHRRGGRVVCDLCPFRCALKPGETGRCQVRREGGGGMQTATWATSVWHLHTVERKPLYHFRPGLRTLTLAAPGCSFRCDYCQNASLSQYGRDAALPWTGRSVDARAAVDEAAQAGAAISLSYSEPTLAAELTLALAAAARPAGVALVWKTNGFITPEALAQVAPHLSAVNIDLKAHDDASHRRLTGAPLRPVLDAVAAFARQGVWIEISTPLIEGFNSSEDDIARLAALVRELGPATPWHLVRALPEYRMQALQPTRPALLHRARDIAHGIGLRHVYVERALGADGRDTRCLGCGDRLIERDIWTLRANRLEAGRCPRCETPLEGVW